MKSTIKGKRYDTRKCEVLGEFSHYNNSNYTGVTYLLRAPDGRLLVYGDSNGQDLYFKDYVMALDMSSLTVDDFQYDDKQEKRMAELGLIEIVA